MVTQAPLEPRMTPKRINAILADSLARARTAPRPPEPPRVSATGIIDGRLALEVGLKGGHGAGCKMIVDEWQWTRIKVVLGDQWGVSRHSSGHLYVVAQGAHSGLRLARWITGAEDGQVVSYRNGNPLDLRASNLVVVDGGEFVAGVFGHGGREGTSFG